MKKKNLELMDILMFYEIIVYIRKKKYFLFLLFIDLLQFSVFQV